MTFDEMARLVELRKAAALGELDAHDSLLASELEAKAALMREVAAGPAAELAEAQRQAARAAAERARRAVDTGLAVLDFLLELGATVARR